MKTILEDVRNVLGLEDESFDDEISMHILSTLAILNQNGVGRSIESAEATWDDFKDPNQTEGNFIFATAKLYTFLKVKQLFDPPQPNAAGYLKEVTDEQLWRLREAYSSYLQEEEEEEEELDEVLGDFADFPVEEPIDETP